MNGGPITAFGGRMAIQNAMRITGLSQAMFRWVMHRDQKTAITNLGVTFHVVNPSALGDIPEGLPQTFCGVEIFLDDEMPRDRMELRIGDLTIVTVKNLAPLPVPTL